MTEQRQKIYTLYSANQTQFFTISLQSKQSFGLVFTCHACWLRSCQDAVIIGHKLGLTAKRRHRQWFIFNGSFSSRLRVPCQVQRCTHYSVDCRLCIHSLTLASCLRWTHPDSLCRQPIHNTYIHTFIHVSLFKHTGTYAQLCMYLTSVHVSTYTDLQLTRMPLMFLQLLSTYTVSMKKRPP